jgi:hypothetical protein
MIRHLSRRQKTLCPDQFAALDMHNSGMQSGCNLCLSLKLPVIGGPDQETLSFIAKNYLDIGKIKYKFNKKFHLL